MYGIPVFDMKKIEPAPEDAPLGVIFDPEPKTRVHAAQSFFEPRPYRLLMRIDD